MRVTRLHLVILFFGLLCAGFGFYSWKLQHPAAFSAHRPAKPPSPAPKIVSTPKPKIQPASTNRTPVTVYDVVKGDTLWTIARDHSPVRAGPGWVGIWKANRTTVKDFDRLEVGWSLQIPPDARAYRTAYWKPRVPTPTVANDLTVDLAQLPAPAEWTPQSANWPPEMPRSLQVALSQNDPMPQALAIALLQSTSMPTSLAGALAKAPAAGARVAEAPQATFAPQTVAWRAPSGNAFAVSFHAAPELVVAQYH